MIEHKHVLKRKSNFELLRIVCMLMIVLQHYSLHSNVNVESLVEWKSTVMHWFSFGGHIAVNCFIMISGYFLSSKKDLKLCKVLSLWIKVWLYSVLIIVILMISGLMGFSVTELIKAFMPILSGRYWFFTVYVFLYLLTPIINKCYHNLTQKEKLYVLILLFIILSVIPTLTGGVLFYLWSYMGVFLWCYLFGAYLREYGFKSIKIARNGGLLLWLCSVAFIFVSMIVFENHIFNGFNYSYFTTLNKIPALLCSCGMFIFFQNINCSSRIINWLSQSVLTVYLIHDNPRIRNWLWGDLFKVTAQVESKFFILLAIATVLMIMLCSIIIDKMLIWLCCKSGVYNNYQIILNKFCIKIKRHIPFWGD